MRRSAFDPRCRSLRRFADASGLEQGRARRRLVAGLAYIMMARRVFIRHLRKSHKVNLGSAIIGRKSAPVLLGAVLAVTIAAGCAAAEPDAHSRVFGWVETIALFPGGLELDAKLDTGARTSSLHVSRYELFKRDARQWIRFRVSDRDGAAMEFERPVVRIARIRRSRGKTVARPIVMLGICIGTRYRDVEVNLTNRRNLKYPVLVGRESMPGIAIDSARQFTSKPRCRNRPGTQNPG